MSCKKYFAQIRVCETCGKEFISTEDEEMRFAKRGQAFNCSPECKKICHYKRVSNSVKSTFNDPVRGEEVRNKMKKTCLEKYGTESAWASDVVKDKIRKTILNKYGVDHLSKSKEIQEIKKANSLIKWGVEHPISAKEVRDKSISTMIERYGVDHFPQSPVSAGEIEIADFIKSIYNGDVIRNTRSVLGGKELDIYIPDKKLAIEFCGAYWHSDVNLKEFHRIELSEAQSYHFNKFLACAKLGIRLLTIWDFDWDLRRDVWCSMLKSILGVQQERVYARDVVL